MEWIEKYIEYWNRQDVEGLKSLFNGPWHCYIDVPFDGGVSADIALKAVPPEKNAMMQLRFHVSEGKRHAARVLYFKTGAVSTADETTGRLTWEYPTMLYSKIILYELIDGKCTYLYELETPKTWCVEDDQDPTTRAATISEYF